MSKHTPGPWKFVEDNDFDSSDMGGFQSGDGSWVCTFGFCETYYPTEGTPPNDADKLLIAAAPDLLSACQRLEWALHLAIQGKPVINADETFAEARSAIAKALG